jgi:hypothetical protein
MHLTITSTVKGAPHSVARCIRSTQDQSFTRVRHIVIALDEETRDAAYHAARGHSNVCVVPPPYRGAPRFASLLPYWRELPQDEVIVWLDGDDWLAVPHALAVIAHAHMHGALVTYGNFILPDGSKGFARQSEPNPRLRDWTATHLKTFRAGLVSHMRDADFRTPTGEYATLVSDLRVMFAALELVPRERAVFLDRALMVYNLQTSFHASASAEERAEQAAEDRRVRSWEPYAPLSTAALESLAGITIPPEAPTRPERPGRP